MDGTDSPLEENGGNQMERSRLVPEMLGEMTGTWRWFGSGK